MPTISDLQQKIKKEVAWNCDREQLIAIALFLKLIKAEDVILYTKRYDTVEDEDDGF